LYWPCDDLVALDAHGDKLVTYEVKIKERWENKFKIIHDVTSFKILFNQIKNNDQF
jgi:hypothetical protein